MAAPKQFAEDRSNRTPGVLLSYQQRWMKDESPVKFWRKSRRIGASWTEAADDALLASRKKGMDCWYVGYNQDMAREFIEDVADWARHYNLFCSAIEEEVVVDEDRDILTFRARFSSGHKVTALSSRPSNLRGKQGKVTIDEAAFHDALDELLKAALALLMWGGRVAVLSTHDGDENPFNVKIEEILAGKWPYSLHTTTIDDALADGLYDRICLRMGRDYMAADEAKWRESLFALYGEDADEELLCIPAKGSGTYIPRVLVKSCMVAAPVLRWNCPDTLLDMPKDQRKGIVTAWCNENLKALLEGMDPSMPSWFGEDFGRTGDLTVFDPAQETRGPGLVYQQPFSVELRNAPYKVQEQVLYYICDRLPVFRGGAMDARGNGQALAEFARQKYGPSRIHEVMLSTNWYMAHMPSYKKALEGRSFLMAEDGDVLDDHTGIKMERGVAKVGDGWKTKGRDGKQRHADAAISKALCWYAIENISGGPIEYESVEARTMNMTRGGAIQ